MHRPQVMIPWTHTSYRLISSPVLKIIMERLWEKLQRLYENHALLLCSIQKNTSADFFFQTLLLLM